MENGIQVFSAETFGSVRVIENCGELFFVARDILRALEYADDYNPSRAIQAVPEEWKGVHRMHTPGGEQEMLTLSEQGLYFFLARSDKPKALPYQKWIAEEVLPSIRKTGSYSMAPKTYADALREAMARLTSTPPVQSSRSLFLLPNLPHLLHPLHVHGPFHELWLCGLSCR